MSVVVVAIWYGVWLKDWTNAWACREIDSWVFSHVKKRVSFFLSLSPFFFSLLKFNSSSLGRFIIWIWSVWMWWQNSPSQDGRNGLQSSYFTPGPKDIFHAIWYHIKSNWQNAINFFKNAFLIAVPVILDSQCEILNKIWPFWIRKTHRKWAPGFLGSLCPTLHFWG